jgi:acetylornithine aminotransferase
MAFRIVSKRVCASLRAPRVNCVSTRFASSAAAAVQGSSLPQELKDSIAVWIPRFRLLGANTNSRQRDSTLATPDPPAGSKTSGLVDQQLPYMVPTYVRPPPMFEKGEGCYMWDVENRKYLDFTAGIAVNALGHCDAGVVEVIAQQV